MKKIRLILISCAVCFAEITGYSCDDITASSDCGEGINVSLSPVVTRAGGADLDFSMYMFDRAIGSTGDYTFLKSLVFDEQGTIMTFTKSELADREYRFLFVAGETGSDEISVVDKFTDGNIVAAGIWNDVRLEAADPCLSDDNYAGVTDMTGPEIKEAGTIEGTLNRFVGQPVYDIYRVADKNVNSPMDIQSADVLSVIDRVYEVDFGFTGLTKRMKFSASNELVPDRDVTVPGSYILTVETGDDARTTVPQQAGLNAVYSPEIAGSTRLYGKCLLPADGSGISVKMDFRYFATLYVCWDAAQSDPAPVHDKS